MKACTIYMTEKHVIIFCEHKAPEGGFFVSYPMVKLERSKTTIKSLGQEVLDVLNASSERIDELDYKAGTQAMVTFAGYKTWGAFANAVDSACLLRADEKQAEVTPAFRDGRGFSHDLKRVVICKRTIDSLGKALFGVLKIKSDESSA